MDHQMGGDAWDSGTLSLDNGRYHHLILIRIQTAAPATTDYRADKAFSLIVYYQNALKSGQSNQDFMRRMRERDLETSEFSLVYKLRDNGIVNDGDDSQTMMNGIRKTRQT
uniref:Uncharacterized protein n=1 Tax=Nelumbo nucifera TaxID=4432 RepID=A0A822Y9Y6_NELNU|nr:TPA_asm: hypothetical protein HUJ06_029273 [Nelumbo nucifera]